MGKKVTEESETRIVRYVLSAHKKWWKSKIWKPSVSLPQQMQLRSLTHIFAIAVIRTNPKIAKFYAEMMGNSVARTMLDRPAIAFGALWREHCKIDGKVNPFLQSMVEQKGIERLLRFLKILCGVDEDTA